MAITISGDRIQIGNFTLTETGSSISGVKKFAASRVNGSLTFDGVLSVASVYNTDSQATTGTFSGGDYYTPLFGLVASSSIDKFPFSTISLAKSVSSLFEARSLSSAASSRTAGYTFGGISSSIIPDGYNYNLPNSGTTGFNARIDRFAFQNDLSAKNVGSLGQGRILSSGQSSSSHGYVTGGIGPTTFYFSTSKLRYPFSTEITTAQPTGGLSYSAGFGRTGFSSSINGYYMARTDGSPSNYVYMLVATPTPALPSQTFNFNGKFPFANDSENANLPSFSGNLPTVMTGVSSPEAGYFVNYCSFSADEVQQYGESTKISKLPFASEVTINFAGYLYGAHQSTSINRFVRGYANRSTITVQGPGYPGSTLSFLAIVCEHNYIASTSNDTMAVLGGGRLGDGSSIFNTGSYPTIYAAPFLYVSMKRMDSFPFASDAFCTYVGDLSTGRSGMVGHSDK
jgi:hypothetical protein